MTDNKNEQKNIDDESSIKINTGYAFSNIMGKKYSLIAGGSISLSFNKYLIAFINNKKIIKLINYMYFEELENAYENDRVFFYKLNPQKYDTTCVSYSIIPDSRFILKKYDKISYYLSGIEIPSEISFGKFELKSDEIYDVSSFHWLSKEVINNYIKIICEKKDKYLKIKDYLQHQDIYNNLNLKGKHCRFTIPQNYERGASDSKRHYSLKIVFNSNIKDFAEELNKNNIEITKGNQESEIREIINKTILLNCFQRIDSIIIHIDSFIDGLILNNFSKEQIDDFMELIDKYIIDINDIKQGKFKNIQLNEDTLVDFSEGFIIRDLLVGATNKNMNTGNINMCNGYIIAKSIKQKQCLSKCLWNVFFTSEKFLNCDNLNHQIDFEEFEKSIMFEHLKEKLYSLAKSKDGINDEISGVCKKIKKKHKKKQGKINKLTENLKDNKTNIIGNNSNNKIKDKISSTDDKITNKKDTKNS